MTRTFSLLLGLYCCFTLTAQQNRFTRQDTLKGSITPERAWWDLLYYDLNMQVNLKDSSLKGENKMMYRVLDEKQVMQVDMQEPMFISSVMQDGKEIPFRREGAAYFIQLPARQSKGKIKEVQLFFEGKPKVSVNPPWMGGISWKKDEHGNPFVASSCQGEGASLWWPCKDHPYDEPDSMQMSFTVPSSLTEVSNGKLRSVVQHTDNTKTFTWFVANPINAYGVNMNIADYAHFSETYAGKKGPLECNYYVLSYNLEKAKKHFAEVRRTLDAFEYWFGPYPFYEDGYKLVEVPYAGMEHQSSVTYGNGYKNGYGNRDISYTSWGMKFDFIIVHESGHEWFANSITNKDVADMWIQEGFTAYSECLFVEYHYGKKAGSEYVTGTRINVLNDRPIIGAYDVSHEGSGDMYYKAANMLHTLRQWVDDDSAWHHLLLDINRDFYHQIVISAQIERYISTKTGKDLHTFFDQYLRDVRIPVLEYKMEGNKVLYRWTNVIKEFRMPVKVFLDDKMYWVEPSEEWKTLESEVPFTYFKVDKNFYIRSKAIL